MTVDDRRSRLEAMLSVSRRVAEGEDLAQTLDHIAHEAALTVGALGATILLVSRQGRLRFGGAWGISDAYREHLENRLAGVATYAGPTGLALTRGEQVVVPHIQEDPVLVQWHDRATSEGYRSLTSTPLNVSGDVVGALNVYRGEVGQWPAGDLELLSFLSDHAAAALRLANFVDRQSRQLAGFEHVLRGLREQTHEYANRVHSIGALIAMGEQDEAYRFIADLLRAHGDSRDAIVAGIEQSTLAGLLLAEIVIARQSGIDLKVDRRSRLAHLPRGLAEAESVALVGSLLEYALEAVVDVPPSRRRVTFRAWSGDKDVVFHVRDWGRQSPPPTQVREVDGVMFNPSASDHRLPSLTQSLLLEAAAGAQGSVSFQPHAVGTTTVVRIPSAAIGVVAAAR